MLIVKRYELHGRVEDIYVLLFNAVDRISCSKYVKNSATLVDDIIRVFSTVCVRSVNDCSL